MATIEPKNERVVCDAIAKFLAERQGDRIVSVDAVDAVVRDRPAVEYIYHTTQTKFAVEHTRIESFPNQIGKGKRFAHLLEPLENELRGRLPGVFFLTVAVGAANSPTAQQEPVRAALAAWILEKAASLEPEERVGPNGNCAVAATPPGVPFEVTLARESACDSRLFAFQGLVGDRRTLRAESIARSLSNKCPKLQAAARDGCISVLILESDDVSLANQAAVSETTAAELGKRNDEPDIVVWARTSTNPWKGALIKDGSNVYPAVDTRPFVLDLSAAYPRDGAVGADADVGAAAHRCPSCRS